MYYPSGAAFASPPPGGRPLQYFYKRAVSGDDWDYATVATADGAEKYKSMGYVDVTKEFPVAAYVL